MATTRRVLAVIEAQDRATPVLKKLSTQLGLLGGVAGAVGAGLIGRQLVRGMAAAVTAASDFETQISKVGAISGASATQMEILSGQAKELGRTTAFSAKEAATAQAEFAKAGFDVREIYRVLPGTLDLAAAGEVELGQAASITSTILRSFNKDASDAGDVADLLAKAANSANTTVTELGDAFSFLGPVAATLGVDLTEATAAIQTLADRGIPGTRAGRNLAAALTEIAKQAQSGVGPIGALRDKLFDAEGKFVGITRALEVFEEAGIRGTDMITIFGAESARALAILANEGSKALGDKWTALMDRAGVASETAEKKLDNLAGSVVKFKSATEGAKIAVGEAFTPVLQTLLDDAITPLVSGFTEGATEGNTLRIAVLDLAIAFSDAGDTTWEFLDALEGLKRLGESDVFKFLFNPLERTKMQFGFLSEKLGQIKNDVLGIIDPILGASAADIELATTLAEVAAGAEATANPFKRIKLNLMEERDAAIASIGANEDAAEALNSLGRSAEDAAGKVEDLVRQLPSDGFDLGPISAGDVEDIDPLAFRFDSDEEARAGLEQAMEDRAARAVEIERELQESLEQMRAEFGLTRAERELAEEENRYNAKIEALNRQGVDTAALVQERELVITDLERKASESRKQLAKEETRFRKTEEQKRRQIAMQSIAIAGSAISTIFGDTKAGAYASAIVNTAEAVTRALASAPPPANFVLAGLVAAAGAVQIATISSTSIAMKEGGFVFGPDKGRDSVPAMLQPGELVIPTALAPILLDDVAHGIITERTAREIGALPGVNTLPRFATGGLVSESAPLPIQANVTGAIDSAAMLSPHVIIEQHFHGSLDALIEEQNTRVENGSLDVIANRTRSYGDRR